MRIRDALRSLRGAVRTAVPPDDVDGADAPEPTWFQPAFDGSYDAPGVEAGKGSLTLRFLPGGKVFESSDADGEPGTGQLDSRRGDYTGAGRFHVQRRFERIVTYAVLDMETGLTPGRPGFLARRIDGTDRSTAELDFIFRPDAG